MGQVWANKMTLLKLDWFLKDMEEILQPHQNTEGAYILMSRRSSIAARSKKAQIGAELVLKP